MNVHRRNFLKAMGTGGAWFLAAPQVVCARDPAQAKEDVLSQAQERIAKYRKASVVLKIFGPDGRLFPSGIDLRIRQTRHKFLFGCNLFRLGRCRTQEDNAAYAEQFARLLNFATLPFYWWQYERQKGQPMDARTDEIVRWCRDHQVTMKGHPLAWNYIDPAWLSGTPEEIMQQQFERIARCIERFKGDIGIWDVVNEATHYDREELKRNAPKLTEAIARIGVGEYVRGAFRIARKADPQAGLIINDYRTDEAYVEKVISQLVDADRKPLYDIIGIQAHMHGGYWGAAQTWAVCERFARFNVPLHFTETTVVSGPKQDSSWTTTYEGEVRQAQQVAEFYTVLFSHPAVAAITWWDFSDQDAWQQAPAGLVRSDMSPKPAYERLYELIKGKWWTRVETQTDADASILFEGFLGDYTVETRRAGRPLTGSFVLDKAPGTPLNVHLS
ncbi:MAG: endo-1,4-beta-xylanase [Phycisphaerae bacterium]|nr:endo-1,4-beta-xylanase [Phycisphaerae bacterium]